MTSMDKSSPLADSPKAFNLATYFIDDYSPPQRRQRSLTNAHPLPGLANQSSESPPPSKRRSPLVRSNSSTKINVASNNSGSGTNAATGSNRFSTSVPAFNNSFLFNKNQQKKSPLSNASPPKAEELELDGSQYDMDDYPSTANSSGSPAKTEPKPSQPLPTATPPTSIFKAAMSGGLSLRSSGDRHSSCPTFSPKDLAALGAGKRTTLEGPLFGVPLQELIAKESKLKRVGLKILVPYIVEDCIVQLVNEEVLQLEGIFRQSGRALDIQAMRGFYDKGKYINLKEYPDLYTIASLLKQYLRSLPEPLITYNMYSSLLDLSKFITEEDDRPVSSMKELLKLLPLENKVILKLLVGLLSKAASFESFNKMNPSNLAIVIGPNIMWSKTVMQAIDVVNDSLAINELTTLLIRRFNDLFDGDEDTDDVSLDLLIEQHKAANVNFPSFLEAQAEQHLIDKEQAARKKSFFNFLKFNNVNT